MARMITVVVAATGRKQQVPAHWVDHPVLGVGLSVPPSARPLPAARKPRKRASGAAPSSRVPKRARSVASDPATTAPQAPASGETDKE